MTEKNRDAATRLALWLDDRERDLILREGDDSPENSSSDGIPFPLDPPIHEDLSPGDVVMLSREFSLPDASGPLCLAVLSNWEDDFFLVGPYSPYSEPATPLELRMSSDRQGLRVLSLWNCHTMQAEFLRKSWLIDKLSDEEVSQAFSVFKVSFRGGDVPPELADRVGPPLLHPRDPRREYQDEQMAKLAPIRETWPSEATEEGENDPDSVDCLVEFLPWLVMLSPASTLAASDGKRQSRSLSFECEDLPLVLIVTSSPRDNQVVYCLESDDDELVGKLDDFTIEFSKDKASPENFSGGEYVHEVEAEKIGFVLRSPEGKAIKLRETSAESQP